MSYYPGFEDAAPDEQATVTRSFNHRDQQTVNEELKRLSWWKKLLLNLRGQVSIGKRVSRKDFAR